MKPWVQSPSIKMAHACHPCTGEVETGGPTVQGHPLLQSEFEASLGYIEILCEKHIKTLFDVPLLHPHLNSSGDGSPHLTLG